VKAEWFLPELDEEPLEPIEDIGTPIDLDSAEPQLFARLTELLHHEGELDAKGVTCAIKDRDDTTCSVCPLRTQVHRLAPLCRIGAEQEEVMTRLAVHGQARS